MVYLAMSSTETQIIGQSPAFLTVLEHVSLSAGLNRPVLIIGERGTGKELIADRLHYLSSRWGEPFLKVNCATLAESLLDSELFGHESGAYTGANRRHQGRFERAGQGTLFLDEITSMSGRLQEKLLRVIEYGEYERLGGSTTLQSRAGIIGAANQDLPGLVKQGKFRADLLDRLSFDVITLPPLRAREEDIILLAEHFALMMTGELKRQYFPGFSGEVIGQLLEYGWPGKVRELKSVIERAVYHCGEGEVVEEVVFDPFASPYRPLIVEPEVVNEVVRTPDQVEQKADIPSDFKAHIGELERDLLRRGLEVNRFNQKKTAEQLGLTYDQLRGYLKKYNLPD
jgi:psp operon transcriptional activator